MQIAATNAVPIATRQTGPAQARPAVHVDPPQAHLESPTPKPAAIHDSANDYFAVQTDPTTKEVIVRLMDAQTGQVIRQIPSEEVVKMARAIAQRVASQNLVRAIR